MGNNIDALVKISQHDDKWGDGKKFGDTEINEAINVLSKEAGSKFKDVVIFWKKSSKLYADLESRIKSLEAAVGFIKRDVAAFGENNEKLEKYIEAKADLGKDHKHGQTITTAKGNIAKAIRTIVTTANQILTQTLTETLENLKDVEAASSKSKK